jgi:hypothetical protein
MLKSLLPSLSQFDNQFFYEEPVGTYLIELESTLLFFDLPSYSEKLKSELIKKKKSFVALLSHGSCGIQDGTRWQKEIDLQVYLHKADRNHPWLKMKPDHFFSEKNIPQFASHLEVIATPGHSPGSICLLDKENKVLFTGDTIGGLADGQIRNFFDEVRDDLPQRFSSCQKLSKYDFMTMLPFHYQPIFTTAKKALTNFVNQNATSINQF